MQEKQFTITSMPASRPAHYYLGYDDSSVFIDFDNEGDNLIVLKRISFDGYGCCNPPKKPIPMNEKDSIDFKKICTNQLDDPTKLREIILRTIKQNQELLWKDALLEYGLL